MEILTFSCCLIPKFGNVQVEPYRVGLKNNIVMKFQITLLDIKYHKIPVVCSHAYKPTQL